MTNILKYSNILPLVNDINDYILREGLAPENTIINRILLEDNIKDHRDFMDKYGTKPYEKFTQIYMSFIDS